ncbi:hypothetical protein ACIBL3_18125 [Kribbella sp. NPDC050124]|uniref:hypothetical protein n=1 Tax=Kribbella sp. NPDC050124 TaxID=3364114 RepID=UPI00378D7ED3
MTKLITRAAAGLAATAIATLPLIIGTSAHAINKHEGGGGDTIVPTPNTGREVDPAQVAAGALAGATVTGVAFAASNRIRREHDSAPRPV